MLFHLGHPYQPGANLLLNLIEFCVAFPLGRGKFLDVVLIALHPELQRPVASAPRVGLVLTRKAPSGVSALVGAGWTRRRCR